MKTREILQKLNVTDEIRDVLENCQGLSFASSIEDVAAFAVKDAKDGVQVVEYAVPGKGIVKEAYVCRTKNGICANYYDTYMRRRDADSMLIGDSLPTDKVRYSDVYDKPFDDLRQATVDWLKGQKLLAFVFRSGQIEAGPPSLAICPDNAGFFALGLAKLQGVVNLDSVEGAYTPKVTLFVAPPFRHTHFDGLQRVVHFRTESNYEVFAYNLYPGPSAKKGIFGALLHYGEKEGWITAHGATVQVVTPYGNKTVIMHEGASGGGKSEMNEHIHRESDGGILFGTNLVTGDKRKVALPTTCDLHPVTDDMAICHPSIQKNNGKLTVADAENAWFIRVDHIKSYGTDPDIERCSVHPEYPLLFLNIDASPNSTALLWDHIEDEPGNPCPNPRFIFPRNIVPDVINQPVSIDIRSFGVRTPPCTAEKPSYGIMGIFHVLPPALAWLWRLVSPRGHDNPSILSTGAMESEGVGSFWPFATGQQVNLANLLLDQIHENPDTHYILCPNRHIGAWKVGFVPQWLTREYIVRRGGIRFGHEDLGESLCPLLGYTPNQFIVEGQQLASFFLKVHKQPEVGLEGFNAGAAQLTEFFHKELKTFLTESLSPLGRKIIQCCLDGGSISDYNSLMRSAPIFYEE